MRLGYVSGGVGIRRWWTLAPVIEKYGIARERTEELNTEKKDWCDGKDKGDREESLWNSKGT